MKIIGIIPSRYASTRFPGKPLIDIKGKTMIQRVYEQTSKCTLLTEIYVATDDDRIYKHVKDFGGNVIMTSPSHSSGTERCFEVAANINSENEDIIINIQGDEPYINPEQIEKLISCFDELSVEIATLIKRIILTEELLNPNVVKVVKSFMNDAIYFSRSPIPFVRGKEKEEWITETNFYKHIGIYGYKYSTLERIVNLSTGELEKAESLEQLRWLESGFKIKTKETDFENIAIDTPEDYLNLINK
jgi:3-deoxy-manno-octulosonate cytidylyltransferase (CMP-KDO synthetase)